MYTGFLAKHSNISQITIIDCLLVCFSFSLALPTALSSVFFILTLLAIPFKKDYLKSLKEFFRFPTVRILICLIIWGIIGIIYSPIPLQEIGGALKQTLRPLSIFLIIPLITPQNQRGIILGFIASMTLTALLALTQKIPGLYFEINPTYSSGAIFKNHITTSFFTAVAFFLATHTALNEFKGKQRFALAIPILLCFHLLFLNVGRTGYVVFAALFILFLFQKYNWKARILGFGVLIILFTMSFQFSQQTQQRMSIAREEYLSYSSETSKRTETSVGLRLEFLYNSYKLLKEKPLLGWGTGAFPEAYRTISLKEKIITCENPHNQYALIAVENGIIGLALLCIFLAHLLWISFSLPKQSSYILQGILIAFSGGSMGNSLLLDHSEGLFFILFTALTLSNLSSKPKEVNELKC